MLLIICVLTLILVTFYAALVICFPLLPFAVTMLEAVQELPGVATSIPPLVLSEAFGLTLVILANIAVAVDEEV